MKVLMFNLFSLQPYPTFSETIPCLNCGSMYPTSAPSYYSYDVMGMSITSESLRVLSVLLILVVGAILMTYAGYVRSKYNKYGELQIKRKTPDISMSTHSESGLLDTSSSTT